MDEMTILRIMRESNRVLLYGSADRYHLIAKLSDDVRVGDVVEYEPFGFNFGWFTRVISRPPVNIER